MIPGYINLRISNMLKSYLRKTGIYEFLFDKLIVPMDIMNDWQTSH